ncbi:hypothetical protein ACWD6P_09600 [Streptomyces sp. NPDC002446]
MEYPNEEIPADRVLSAEEGIEIKQRIAAQRSLKIWRWMGNYQNPGDVATVANSSPPSVAGEVIASYKADGKVAAWIFW